MEKYFPSYSFHFTSRRAGGSSSASRAVIVFSCVDGSGGGAAVAAASPPCRKDGTPTSAIASVHRKAVGRIEIPCAGSVRLEQRLQLLRRAALEQGEGEEDPRLL